MNVPSRSLNPNLRAFLDMIAVSEIGRRVLAASDNGYNVIVGNSLFDDKGTPDLADDYADHPRKKVWIEKIHNFSTAAGRYQLLARYFDSYKAQLRLPDFSPASQDAIAIQQICEQHAFFDITAGRLEIAVAKVANIWASMPGAGYAQHENKIADLRLAYQQAGGRLA